jgi:hypothetical protein
MSFPLLHERVIFAAASDESTVEADKGWFDFIGADLSSRDAGRSEFCKS